MVASHVTAEMLRHEKPFLLLSLLAATCYDDMPLQRRLGREMKLAITNKMISGKTVSLQVLQALLVHLAW